jgi:hypothetical protein
MSDASVISKTKCPACAAKGLDYDDDNLINYDNGTSHCFACGYDDQGKQSAPVSELIAGPLADLSRTRGIKKEATEKYRVREKIYTGYVSKKQYVTNELIYIFPYTENGVVVAQKLRSAVNKKVMGKRGKTKGNRFFGQDKFEPSKQWPIIIVAGEFDALASYQMTGVPTVSLPDGIDSCVRVITENMTWLSQWKEVIISFDNSPNEQSYVEKVIPLFEPGFARNMTFELNDANDMLRANKTEEYKKALWNAQKIKPKSVVSFLDIIDELCVQVEWGSPWPWKYMDLVTYGIRKKEVTLISADTGIGKEQPMSALISTPNGWKEMGSLRVGDIIHGQTGTTKVVKIFPQGVKPVYRLVLSDGRSCEAGLEHLWKTYSRDQIYKNKRDGKDLHSIRTTAQMLDMHLDNIYLPNCNAVEYSDKNLIIPPYSLGVLIGDGCLTCPGLSISSSEIDIIEAVSSDLGLAFTKNPLNFTYTFLTKGANTVYKKYINDIGLNVKSHEKFIPNEYLQSSVNQRLSLLQGLFDTDGSVSPSGSFSYSTTSSRLAKDVVELARSLGIITKIKKENRNKYKSGVCFIIRFITNKIIFTSRKHAQRYKRYTDRIKNRSYSHDHVSIKSIEYIRDEESQCIVVDSPDHLYLTNDYIVTHNTAWAYNVVANWLMNGQACAHFDLERSKQESGQRSLGLIMGEPIHLPDYADFNKERIRQKAEEIGDSMHLYDVSSGLLDLESVLSSMRYLRKAHNVTLFVIDNLLALASYIGGTGASHEFASKAIGRVKHVTNELDVHTIVLNHVIKDITGDDANNWQTGRLPTIDHIYGGKATAALADNLLVAARDVQNSDPSIRETLLIQPLKSKFHSKETGKVFRNYLDHKTGRLVEFKG